MEIIGTAYIPLTATTDRHCREVLGVLVTVFPHVIRGVRYRPQPSTRLDPVSQGCWFESNRGSTHQGLTAGAAELLRTAITGQVVS